MMRRTFEGCLWLALAIAGLGVFPCPARAYSVLTDEAIVDIVSGFRPYNRLCSGVSPALRPPNWMAIPGTG